MPTNDSAVPSAAALAMIDRLVAIPTVSRDSNLGLIELARDHLAAIGARPHLVYDRREAKASLFCTLADDAERAKSRGIVLAGHTDVVPVDGQDWATDPFRAHHEGGRIYGRGSADMKGFVAIALAWAERFLAAQERRPVHLAFTYDEETTFAGARGLAADLAARGVAPEGCILGEPTDMRAVVAHKGRAEWRCRVRGREAHSSLTTRGVNAIEGAARIAVRIREIADRIAQAEPPDARFDPPYTTLQTGVIRGGIAGNVVPRDCELLFEIRSVPGASHASLADEIRVFAERELVPAMRRVAPEAGVAFEPTLDLPAFGIEADAPIVRLAQRFAGSERLGAGAVGFATEASVYHAAGIPTVVLGPGSIEQAHAPNEFLSYAQVAACERLFERLARTPA